MSWSIPAQIEQDIISGKAQYRTFQTGSGGQSILPVPNNAYVVVFGYDYSPAGGGLYAQAINSSTGASVQQTGTLRWLETQQISFYTGSDFFPFIHHFDIIRSQSVRSYDPVGGNIQSNTIIEQLDNSPVARQTYITSDKDITITVGLIINAPVASQNAIPQTNRTPALLTYGGSGQAVNTQTNFGPAATPIQFMQPSPKDYQDFGFGLLPNGASGQVYATPDATNGLLDPSNFLNSLGAVFRDSPSCNYFLNLHYALYTQTVPEQRG